MDVLMQTKIGNHVASLLEISDKLPHLKAIISMDSLVEGAPVPGVSSASSILRAWANDRGIKLFDFDQIEALGREYPRRHVPPQSEEGMTKLLGRHGRNVFENVLSDSRNSYPLRLVSLMHQLRPSATQVGPLVSP